jgi:hypothetical protein
MPAGCIAVCYSSHLGHSFHRGYLRKVIMGTSAITARFTNVFEIRDQEEDVLF